MDFRLISATNRPLDQFVREGRFREDLYYRVNAFSIRLPSLRERQVDIPVLGAAVPGPLLRGQRTARSTPRTFSREALEALAAYPWPGNIRELESTVSRAALSAPGRVIRGTDVDFLHASAEAIDPAAERLASLRETERAHIVRVLEAVGWNKKEAAEVLEISRGTLYRKITEYDLEPRLAPCCPKTGQTSAPPKLFSAKLAIYGCSVAAHRWGDSNY